MIPVEDRKYINIDSNQITVEDTRLTFFPVEVPEIKAGNRFLTIPEGVESIDEEAFIDYNSSEIINNLFDLFANNEEHLTECKKRILSKKRDLPRIPKEYKSLEEKAGYLLKLEIEDHLLGIELPASFKEANYSSFPALLESIDVSPNNEVFTSKDGVLFSKDMKTLIRYPGFQDIEEYTIPDSVERIGEKAFSNAVLQKLIISSSVKEYSEDAFRGCLIDELILDEGIETIPSHAFNYSNIRKISLPSSLTRIDDYAFEGLAGLKALESKNDELSIGRGIFQRGTFSTIKWWCWGRITQGAFLNADIKIITIPDGVTTVDSYAFAGCYKVTKVTIPDSVVEIGDYAFDFGPSFSNPVTMPDHLGKYIFRFPPLARINGKTKTKLWPQDTDFKESQAVLEKQIENLESVSSQLKFYQISVKNKITEEKVFIEQLLQKYNS